MLSFVFRLVFAVLTVCGFGWGQPASDTPIDIEIPFHPIPVKAESQLHLLYELHLTNFHSQTQILRSWLSHDGVGRKPSNRGNPAKTKRTSGRGGSLARVKTGRVWASERSPKHKSHDGQDSAVLPAKPWLDVF